MINNDSKKEVRVRFAPSPTGFVHIGNLRTVIYGYLIAKKYKGKFIVRLEDTDQSRYVEGSVQKIFDALDWVGIKPDEGVVGIDEKGNIQQKGKLGPYVQSERLEIYKKCAQELVEKGKAYYCFCSSERLEELRKQQQKDKQAPMYDKCCQKIRAEEARKKIKSGEKYVIRMKVPKNEEVEFVDKVFGKISIGSNTIDDQVLIKSDGFPTYHLAVVVDDHLMKISHITRGEDWLPSTPKHVLLYEFFGWEKPEFIHFPNVLGENHKKLSKRQGDVSVEDFKNKGYLPEAIFNFLALLGWNPGKGSTQEIFSKEELIEKFNIENIHKAGAVFDFKKLDWMNAHYIKQKSDEELFKLCAPYLEKYAKENNFMLDKNLALKIVQIEKERMKKLSDVVENIDFYFRQPEYDRELLRWKGMPNEKLINSLKASQEVILDEKLENLDEKMEWGKSVWEIPKVEVAAAQIQFRLNDKLSPEEFSGVIDTNNKDKKYQKGFSAGELYWPLRVALSGQKNSPSPAEIAWAIGKKESIKRIENAIEKINAK